MFSGLRCWSPQAYALLVSGRTSGRTVSQPSPTLFVLAPGHLRPHKASYTSRRRLSSHQKGCTRTAAVAASGELTLRAGLPAPPFHSRVAGLFSPDGSPNPFRTYGSSFYSSLSRGLFSFLTLPFVFYFARTMIGVRASLLYSALAASAGLVRAHGSVSGAFLESFIIQPVFLTLQYRCCCQWQGIRCTVPWLRC